nr:protein transport protein SEC24-like CEF [Tanacetum cinerariifolium]
GGEDGDEWRLVARWRRGGEVRLEMMTMRGWCRSKWSKVEWWCVASVVVRRRHVKRRPQTAPVRRVKAMLVEGSRRRGRPKLRWEDRLKQDMKELRLS